jgi:hypothetical protein
MHRSERSHLVRHQQRNQSIVVAGRCVSFLARTNLRRVLKSYADYYNCVRTHRSFLGGLHHRYARVQVVGTHSRPIWVDRITYMLGLDLR